MSAAPNDDNGPHVCPGCYAVAPDPCAPGCIDAEIAAQKEREREDGMRDEDADEDLS
jgi:hypothetical protein